MRIAVMGVTGSGKSTFIRTASKSEEVVLGHDLHSCTSEVMPYNFKYRGQEITLIDTPGFNDTTRSETEILKDIADWLDMTYRNPPHHKLTGIVYLQNIMDPKMYGSSLRNLKMFKDLCGENPLKNVVLVTTRWGIARKSEQEDVAVKHEQELATDPDFWAPLISRGARVARFEDTEDSALMILLSLAKFEPVVLQIQEELVDEAKNLIDTTAGNNVNEEALRLEKVYKEQIAQIQKEMDEALAARDHEVQVALRESKEGFERKLDKVRDEQDMLRYERRNENRRMQNQLDQLRRDSQRRKPNSEKELEKQYVSLTSVLTRGRLQL